MNEKKKFTNGFESWQETHFEISVVLHDLSHSAPTEYLNDIRKNEGRMGISSLAKELTDKFELLNKDREWNGEFFEAIDSFVKDQIA